MLRGVRHASIGAVASRNAGASRVGSLLKGWTFEMAQDGTSINHLFHLTPNTFESGLRNNYYSISRESARDSPSERVLGSLFPRSV